jgi:hypothetical protein
MSTPYSPWQVSLHPSPQFAFFISHVAEDTEDVKQLKAAITAESGRGGQPGLACFLDCENWETGNENGWVIRDYLRKSEFMLAWITPAYLRNKRGWVWFELSYAEILEFGFNNLPQSSGLGLRYIAPLFRRVKVKQVERTPWLNYWQRSLVRPDLEYPIPEIARIVVDYHTQETRKRRLPPTSVAPL